MTKETSATKGPAHGDLPAVRRRAASISPESLVKVGPLFPDRDLPLLIEPTVQSLSLSAWAESNRSLVNAGLLHHGGILFRGFDQQKPSDLEQVMQAISGEFLKSRERSYPRDSVAGNIYGSTAYPPDYPIFVRNESSYKSQWPLKIFLFCREPAITRGETTIADVRRVLRHIDSEIRERFARKGCMYIRNFSDDFGLSWSMAFETFDRAEVEAHCAKSGIQIEWKEGNRLWTRAVRPATARHPKTGEAVWFNHATFFHISTLEPDIREALLSTFDERDLPTNTYYGDGLPIEPEVVEHLREAYRRETVSLPWQKGDLLLLDNMLVAHGRAPFTGPRQVLVGMAELVTRDETVRELADEPLGFRKECPEFAHSRQELSAVDEVSETSPSNSRTANPGDPTYGGALSFSSEISALYSQIRELIARSTRELEASGEIDRKIQRLRGFQEAESEALERRFEERLRLRSGTGWAHLQRIKHRLGDA